MLRQSTPQKKKQKEGERNDMTWRGSQTIVFLHAVFTAETGKRGSGGPPEKGKYFAREFSRSQGTISRSIRSPGGKYDGLVRGGLIETFS